MHTDRIHRYAARTNKLIGDLLDVASIEAGKLAVVPVRADAALLISEAVDTFHDTASAKGISLVAGDVDRPLICEFDYPRLLQVCRSIVQAHGGRIWVESELGAGSTVHIALPDPSAR
jgi:signal transduction histidine kinase